ncbi:hypothetical protein T08_12139 [Trichinella sp. T8]|nr:hypothetical protein T08_12139 [Trichinella sp. T8]
MKNNQPFHLPVGMVWYYSEPFFSYWSLPSLFYWTVKSLSLCRIGFPCLIAH